MCAKKNYSWLDEDNEGLNKFLQTLPMDEWGKYLNANALDGDVTTWAYPPELTGLEQVEKILERYDQPDGGYVAPSKYNPLEDPAVAGGVDYDIRPEYRQFVKDYVDSELRRNRKEVEDVSINIPGRPQVERDLKVDLTNVTNPATQAAIKKIFDEMNGKGVAKPVIADPEKLARLLTIGLVRLQERLVSATLDTDEVDSILGIVAESFEYVIVMAQQAGMIKVLVKREVKTPNCKKRTIILGAPDLEE